MKPDKTLRILVVLAAALAMALPAIQSALAAPPGPATPRTFWVNDPGDSPDANPADNLCDTGGAALPGTGRRPCTLRAAIQQANASAGADVIAFELCPTDFASNGDVPGSYRISPPAPLPAVTDSYTYFNGYTQGYGQPTAGYDDPATNAAACNGAATPRLASANTNNFSLALNVTLAVEIDGAGCASPAPENDADQTTPVSGGVIPSGSILRWNGTAGACSGFTVTSDRNVFAGLNIRNWRNTGILIMPLTYVQVDKPSENAIWGDYIGANVSGSTAQANRFGVAILGGAHSNYIGDTQAIPAWGVGDAAWSEEPTNNERNLISGNDNPYFVYGYACAEGGVSTTFRDDGAGVFMGVDPCIRRNGDVAEAIFTGGALDNHVRNSYIGVSYLGTAALPNSSGVWLNYDAGAETLPGNHIGGCVVLPFTAGVNAACEPQTDRQQDPNLISGNRRLIGGMQTLGGHGVWLNGLTSSAAHREGTLDVSYNEIGGNFIGVNAAGTGRLANSGNGVYLLGNQTVAGIDGPDHNEVGATTEYLPGLYAYQAPYTPNSYRYGNVLSANGNATDSNAIFGDWDNGVELNGSGTEYNRVGYGNVIGLGSQGTNVSPDLGNGDNGVYIWGEAQHNYIHNNSPANLSVPYAPAANDATSVLGAISDNGDFTAAQGRHGVRISGSAQFNRIFRNCIGGNGVDCSGVDFGNHGAGVYIDGSAVHTWVGLYAWTTFSDPDAPQPNWIHHNETDGVVVTDNNTLGHVIRFNGIWRNGDTADGPVDGHLGIDLAGDNDENNDSPDSDTGANNIQNYPVNRSRAYPWRISFTQPAPCTDTDCRTDVYVTLVSESDWAYPYPITDPQPANNGEGRYWLLSVQGNAADLDLSAQISNTFGGVPPADVCITLTTTRSEGAGGSPTTNLWNTSEFSPCLVFNPTAVKLDDVAAHSNAPAIGGAALLTLALCGAGMLALRRRKSQ